MDERLLSRKGQIDLMREEGLLAKSGEEEKKPEDSQPEESTKEDKQSGPQKLIIDEKIGIPICEDCGKLVTDARGCPNCIHNAYRDENPFEPNN